MFFADVLPLSVSGTEILIGGTRGSLVGNSFFWTNNYWGCERFYNADVVKWLKTDWKSNVLRCAMGVDENGGYLQDPESNKERLITVVDAAIANDMYVIIDWHSWNAHKYQAQAIAFFEEMAKTYGDKCNVIYELYNEPKPGYTWKDDVKPYAIAVIEAIRAIDKKNLIIVGTPNWSQDVDVAADDPITGFENIVYALHFYAVSHHEKLRKKADEAIKKNLPLFVTEWGTVNASGNGTVAREETITWYNFIKARNLSNTNWSVCDKNEGASIVKPGTRADGEWSENDLTESGKFVRELIRNWYK